MKTFAHNFPILLKQIDELTIGSYRYLHPGDEVYYLGEYTPRKGAAFSEMNHLILNYKKETDRKGKAEWQYKEDAIEKIAVYFRQSIFYTKKIAQRAKDATFTPIPPAAAKNSSHYDDRNLKLLQTLMPGGDVRELIVQKQSREPLHSSKNRQPADLKGNYCLNKDCTTTNISEIWLFDDVLTQGTHFRAAHDFLINCLPGARIVGFFVARTVYI